MLENRYTGERLELRRFEDDAGPWLELKGSLPPHREELSFPRGVPHRWWNAGDQTLVFEGFAKPLVDLDRYLQAVFEVIDSGPEGRPSLFYIAHAARRHRTTQAAFVTPRPVLAVLFPILVGLGTLLGKYRGTEWPGCPVRCTGAPIVAAEDA